MRWEAAPSGEAHARRTREIEEATHLLPPVARALASRRLSPDQVLGLLDCAPADAPPAREIRAAAAALNEHRGEVGILCDYDVDGAAAAGIFARAVRRIWPGRGLPVVAPERNREGYGPNPRCLEALRAQGVRCVLVLDCGADRGDLLDRWTRETGIPTVVVDHHPADEWRLPRPPSLVVNPAAARAPGSEGACTGRLAMEVARAFLAAHGAWNGQIRRDAVWLAGLATICDVMRLDDPTNRALVRAAEKLAPPAGLEGLLGEAEGEGEGQGKANAREMGWTLGPVLNAGSRMGSSQLASLALTTPDPAEARRAIKRLQALNADRKRVSRQGNEALRAREATREGPVNVEVWEEGHVGAAGPAAGRLADVRGWPAVVLCPMEGEEDALGGSGRSALGFDLGSAVREAQEEGLIEKGGGHTYACGVTLRREQVQGLRAWLARRYEAECEGRRPAVRPEARLRGADLGRPERLCESLDRLTPFGEGIRAPLFEMEMRVTGIDERPGGHVFLEGAVDGWPARAVRWFGSAGGNGELRRRASRGEALRLAGEFERNEWRGTVTHRMSVKAIEGVD